VWPRAAFSPPLLFLIYINDLPTVIKHSRVALYADDAVLYCYSSNPADLESALNDDLLGISNWLNDNKLTLNVGKTKSLLIDSDFRLRKGNSISVPICGTEVEGVESFKYLGVVLSSNPGGRVLPNIGYIGMCGPKGYGFSAVLVRKVR